MVGEILRTWVRRARHRVYADLRATGLFRWIAASAWRRRRLLILCYHGVSLRDEHEYDPELFVTVDHLRRRFSLLREAGYHVLPLGEAVGRLRRDALPPRSVVLTFDDGFYSFFAAAAPLLEEFGYPATVYLTTYYCLNQRPIPRLIIRYLLWRARSQVMPAGLLPGQKHSINLQDVQHREQLVTNLYNDVRLFSNDPEGRQQRIGQIATRLGIDWKNIMRSRLFHLMTAEEVRNIAHRGFNVQLHTHRHRTPRAESAFRREVLENRRIIEDLTGQPTTHFCYPSGDVDPVFLPWLRDLGVETATTCSVALAKVQCEPLWLPRYVDSMAQSESLFESWLSGAGEILRFRSVGTCKCKAIS